MTGAAPFSVCQPVISAGKQPLRRTMPGPDMRQTIQGWSNPITLQVTTVRAAPNSGSADDAQPGDAQLTIRTVQTCGFIVATEPKELDIKTDGIGTRQWKFWLLYLLTDPKADVGDKISFDGKVYKILRSWDRSQNGFFKFGLQEDFQR